VEGALQAVPRANGDIRAWFQGGLRSAWTFSIRRCVSEDDLKADVGIYGQDAWTINRLTLNYGARWEYFASGIPQETSTAGRFAAERTFGPIDMPTWKSITPRFGAVYDLFGNQKTAVKVSVGKYMQMGSTGFSESYNPLALTTASATWNDLNEDGSRRARRGCVSGAGGARSTSRSCRPGSALPTSRPSIRT
jgi:hypothetical protein